MRREEKSPEEKQREGQRCEGQICEGQRCEGQIEERERRERERVARTQCSSRRGDAHKNRCCPPGGGGVVIPFYFRGIRLRRCNLSNIWALSSHFGAYLKIRPSQKKKGMCVRVGHEFRN